MLSQSAVAIHHEGEQIEKPTFADTVGQPHRAELYANSRGLAVNMSEHSRRLPGGDSANLRECSSFDLPAKHKSPCTAFDVREAQPNGRCIGRI
jgi:hypothetical protein